MLRILKVGMMLLFLSSCGYTPIYSNQKNTGLNINIVSLEGEKDLNIYFANKLKRNKDENSERIFDTKIISKYEKENLTKDEAGNTTNFRLILDVDFIVKINGIDKTISYIEKFDIKESDTLFEQSNYEKTIRKDMMDLIIQKFTSQLLTIQ